MPKRFYWVFLDFMYSMNKIIYKHMNTYTCKHNALIGIWEAGTFSPCIKCVQYALYLYDILSVYLLTHV